MTSVDHHPAGVLPDPVIRDPASNGWLFACSLAPDLTRDQVTDWLLRLTEAVRALETPDRHGDPVATAAVGFGPSFFATSAGPRFGLENAAPAAFRSPRTLPPTAQTVGQGDVLIYVMSRSEGAVAAFELALSRARPALISVDVERGYQRGDRREPFGFRDGARIVASKDRQRVVFTDTDRQPEEPDWTDGGTYLAYLKVHQDLDAMAQLPIEQQEAAIGRRKADGSRLDLPLGADPHGEGEFTGPTPTPDSHVRKAGPRGAVHDQTQIFRRGVPYLALQSDGSVDAGLQFVSFQASLDAFDVILSRWMLNPAFPVANSNQDALFARGLVSILKGGIYFVAPDDGRSIGAVIFDPPAEHGKPRHGRVVIRKRSADTTGQPILAELGGVRFQLIDPETGQAIGDPFSTDSAGHAVAPVDVKIGTTVLVHELDTLPGFQATADTSVVVEHHRELVTVTNVATSPTTGYGG